MMLCSRRQTQCMEDAMPLTSLQTTWAIPRFLRLALLATCVISASCGGGGGASSGPALSRGLKIFATPENHVGDFANDPTLVGSTWAEKADDFCNNSSGRPDGAQYKAMMVDGSIRDAVSASDWVLQPDTTYFRVIGSVEVGTTDSSAAFIEP